MDKSHKVTTALRLEIGKNCLDEIIFVIHGAQRTKIGSKIRVFKFYGELKHGMFLIFSIKKA